MTDAVRLDKLAEEYSTHADYCRHMAEGTVNGSFQGALGATKLAEEAMASSRANR